MSDAHSDLSGAAQGGMGSARAFPLPFTMAFQPIVRLSTGTIDAHEALVRGPAGELAHTILKAVSPETRVAFDQACRVKAITLAASLGLAARLNINIMPNAIDDPEESLVETLAAAARHGVRPEALTFEIIEDERLFDTGFMRRLAAIYRRHGALIALDDFGAGYAGTNTLLDLAPDIVKLDIKLVRGIDRDPAKRARTEETIGFCRSMGVEITAEGVETPGELAVLVDAGVDLFQGYLFARPAFERLVTEADLAHTDMPRAA
jgi:EAL domain-containing protein (putative c-di-GMP-specific phosphodiesterase class I)